MGLVFILSGIYFHAVMTGRLHHTEANEAYWAQWRETHPWMGRWLAPGLVFLGVLRIALSFVR